MRTIAEINHKIAQGQATTLTITQAKTRIAEIGISAATQEIDLITTGTFEPMESSGAILNIGHSDPPIKIRQCWLDHVLAYSGFGAVDLYLGAAQPSDIPERNRGGGHVIADLVAGKSIPLKATGYQTDCYPRDRLETRLTQDSINQFYLFNPRNLYQNFIVGVNSGDRPLLTYLGPLQPRFGNAVYSNLGSLSPLLNDPHLDLIGIGSRIFLGGGIGYVAWEGTQHFPLQKRLPNDTPIGPAATLALIGDAKQMDAQWVRGCYFKGFGPSLMLGIGIPLPVLNERVIEHCAVRDEDLVAPVMDFAIPRRVRPSLGLASYAQLRSGKLVIEGRSVRVAPLSSRYLANRIAEMLKGWVDAGQFALTEPVAALPKERELRSQNADGSGFGFD